MQYKICLQEINKNITEKNMYNSLLKFMLAATLWQLGLKLTDINNCRDRQCVQKMDQARAKVLKINWKPISVFPNDFNKYSKSKILS